MAKLIKTLQSYFRGKSVETVSGNNYSQTLPKKSKRGTEKSLFTDRLQIERKVFFFELKENMSGRFLKITEDVGGRRETIIVPATGLADFCETIQRADKSASSLPDQDREP